jgi:hypothetical protein
MLSPRESHKRLSEENCQPNARLDNGKIILSSEHRRYIFVRIYTYICIFVETTGRGEEKGQEGRKGGGEGEEKREVGRMKKRGRGCEIEKQDGGWGPEGGKRKEEISENV